MNNKYIAIAAPTFLNMLEICEKRRDGSGEIDAPVHSSPGSTIGDPPLSTMRARIGTLCSMIEAGVLERSGSAAPRVPR